MVDKTEFPCNTFYNQRSSYKVFLLHFSARLRKYAILAFCINRRSLNAVVRCAIVIHIYGH